MPSRLEVFREYMRHLDTATNPTEAIKNGLCIRWPGRQPYEDLSARLALNPASSHLLVGGIGTGKTTQLLLAQEELNKLPDTLAIYLDVSKRQDLDLIKPGTVLALACVSLLEAHPGLPDDKRDGFERQLLEFTQGSFEKVASQTLESLGAVMSLTRDVWRPGLISVPGTSASVGINKLTKILQELRATLPTERPNLVFLLDSLDRLFDRKGQENKFEELVQFELRALRSLGVGIVLAVSNHLRRRKERLVLGSFERVYEQPLLNPAQEKNRSFFLDVLHKRISSQLLPTATAEILALSSGGVLRDLLSMARTAGEEAYVDGLDTITPDHAKIAIDSFSRALSLRLQEQDLQKLQRFVKSKNALATADDLPLLAAGCLLEYPPGEEVRYAVHPTLLPCLERQAA